MSEFVWDDWQRRLIGHRGHVSARCGRQTGKSTAVGKRIESLMLEFVGSVHLVIAPAERQSSGLFEKALGWLEVLNQERLLSLGGYVPDHGVALSTNLERKRRWEFENGIFNELPTKTSVVLKRDFTLPPGIDNVGSKLFCYPAGRTGVYLRFMSLDFLHMDEAAFIPDVVYDTLKPMLAISEAERGLGWETQLSTPDGKGGFFYKCHHSKDFLSIHISAEDCPRYSKKFLQKEQRRMSKMQYAQEYLAEFIDEWQQFFPTDLLHERMSLMSWDKSQSSGAAAFYLGVDLARYGGDEVAYVIVESHKDRFRVVKCFTRTRVSLTASCGEIQALHREYDFRRIFIDSGGLGQGALDILQEKLSKRLVVGLDNSSKSVSVSGEERRGKILKEDLYSNVLVLLESGRLELINDLDLLRSMRSITYEYTSDSNVKIWGKYSHLTEALVRACWCVKDRGLRLYVY